MRPLNQDVEQLGAEPPTAAAVENASDEANILTDQDETQMLNLQDNDPNIGSDGTNMFEPSDFVRGEVDLKEQMDRALAAMDDAVNHMKPKH